MIFVHRFFLRISGTFPLEVASYSYDDVHKIVKKSVESFRESGSVERRVGSGVVENQKNVRDLMGESSSTSIRRLSQQLTLS